MDCENADGGISGEGRGTVGRGLSVDGMIRGGGGGLDVGSGGELSAVLASGVDDDPMEAMSIPRP